MVGRAGWLALLILSLVYLCHGLDRMIVSILLEPIKAEYRISDSQAGFIASLAYGLAVAAAGIPAGLLIDRTNRRNLLAGILAIWSVATALGGFTTNAGSLIAARMAVGAAEAGGAPAAVSLISDLFPPARRATAVGLFYFAAPLGSALAFLLGGLVAASHGWRAAFWMAGAPGLMVALLLLIVVREPRRGAFDDPSETRPAGPAPLSEALRSITGSPCLLSMMIGLGLSSMMQSAYLSWQASFLIREHGFDVRQAGLVVGLATGLFGAAGAALGGTAADAFATGSVRRMIVFAAGVVLLGVLAASAALLAPGAVAASALFMLYAVFINAYYGPGFAVIAGLSDSRVRGAVLGVFYVIMNLVGFGLGPFTAGWLSDLYGGPDSLRWALLSVGGFYGLAVACFIRAYRTAPS